MEMFEMFRTVKCYGRYMSVWLIFLDKLKFHMSVVRAHLATITIVVDILCNEYRRLVARAERLELLEQPEELGGNLLEIQI